MCVCVCVRVRACAHRGALQCVQVLGAWRGVCRDDRLGALDSNQVFTARRDDGLTVVSYRRNLQPGESVPPPTPLPHRRARGRSL